MDYCESLPDRDYGLQMRFRKGEVGDFFRPTAGHAAVVEERRRWLSGEPERYCAMLPEGAEMMREAVGMAAALGTLPEGVGEACFVGLDAGQLCRWLGENWEADFLLMKADVEGVFRLRGGCVCFPSHWDLREKLGCSMAEIHGVVPGLNEELGAQIDGFLRRIKPGISWERANWGLTRSAELNLHPARGLARLDGSVGLDEVWWRLELQSLVSLPVSGGILFGIRLVIRPLAEIREDAEGRRGLVRALESMPEEMARYKGIAGARGRLVELLGG